MKKDSPRVAFFPCVYHEVDGVAKTSRELEAFARRHQTPFFMVHAGPRDEVTTTGAVTRVQLARSPLTESHQTHPFHLVGVPTDRCPLYRSF